MARQRGEDGLQMVLLCQSSGERRLARIAWVRCAWGFFSWIKNVLLLREKGFVQSPELAPNPDPFQLEAAPCVLHFLSQPIFLLSLSHCSILFLLFCLHWITLFS